MSTVRVLDTAGTVHTFKDVVSGTRAVAFERRVLGDIGLPRDTYMICRRTTHISDASLTSGDTLMVLEASCDICVNVIDGTHRQRFWCIDGQCTSVYCTECAIKYMTRDPHRWPQCGTCRTPFTFQFIKRVMDAQQFKSLSSTLQSATLAQDRVRWKPAQAVAIQERKVNVLSQEVKTIRAKLKETEAKLRRAKKSPGVTLGRKCPTDDCRGYVDITTSACVLCEQHWCTQCLAQHPPSRRCTAHDRQVAKSMQDSRPCPVCGVQIHRTHGCNHMRCTYCSVTFDYDTSINLTTTHTHEYEPSRLHCSPIHSECPRLDKMYHEHLPWLMDQLPSTTELEEIFNSRHRQPFLINQQDERSYRRALMAHNDTCTALVVAADHITDLQSVISSRMTTSNDDPDVLVEYNKSIKNLPPATWLYYIDENFEPMAVSKYTWDCATTVPGVPRPDAPPQPRVVTRAAAARTKRKTQSTSSGSSTRRGSKRLRARLRVQ